MADTDERRDKLSGLLEATYGAKRHSSLQLSDEKPLVGMAWTVQIMRKLEMMNSNKTHQ